MLESRVLLTAPEVSIYAWQAVNSNAEDTTSATPGGPLMGAMVTINNSMNAVPKLVTISWSFQPGSASAADYVPAPFTSWAATIPARTMWTAIGPSMMHPELAGNPFFGQVYGAADNLVEGTEVFTGLFHVDGGKFQNNDDDWACQYIINDSPAYVRVGGYDPDAHEGPTGTPAAAHPAEVALVRYGGDLDAPLTTGYDLINVHTTNADFVDIHPPAVFEAGQVQANVRITAADDTEREKLEDAQVMLKATANHLLTGTWIAPLQIIDNDWGLQQVEVDFPGNVILNDDGDAYDAVEWKDANADGTPDQTVTPPAPFGPSCPVAVGRSKPGYPTRLTLEPTFSFDGPLSQGNYKIEGTATAGGGSYVWSKEILLSSQQQPPPPEHRVLRPGVMTSEGIVGELIDADYLTITWKITGDGREPLTYTTRNRLYVTGVGPNDGVYHTVLEIGCEGAKGTRPTDVYYYPLHPDDPTPPTSGATFGESLVVAPLADKPTIIYEYGLSREGIWDAFKDRKVFRVKDEVNEMRYAHGPTVPLNYQGLLAQGEGTCGAWSRLLEACWAAQGVESSIVKVFQSTPDPAPPPPPAGDTWGVSSLGIRVKPLKAQGTKDANYPRVDFQDHAVVRADDDLQTIYDPSYGVRYRAESRAAVEQEWENECLERLIWFYLSRKGVEQTNAAAGVQSKTVAELTFDP